MTDRLNVDVTATIADAAGGMPWSKGHSLLGTETMTVRLQGRRAEPPIQESSHVLRMANY